MLQDKQVEYNGWTNYETWNVALAISENLGLFRLAQSLSETGYSAFAERSSLQCPHTIDQINWNDPVINVQELDQWFKDLN